MALEIKFEITEAPDRKSFTFTDTTGEYDLSNIGGWGVVNPLITSAIPPGIIEVMRPGSTNTYLISVSSLPSNMKGQRVVLNTELGLQAIETLPDGPYIIRYKVVTTGPVNHEAAGNFLLSGNIDCCLQKIGAKVNPPDGSCCDPAAQFQFGVAKALLFAACNAVGCGKLARAQVMTDYLTDYCSKNCSGC
jgi:hypothetical protein